MTIRFTDHARMQLKEMNIPEADIIEVIHKPDRVIRQSSVRLRAVHKIRICMRFNYHKSKDAFYIRFDEAAYAESDEVEEGVIFDYDKNGKIIAIEILDASKKLAPSFRASLLRKEIPLSVGA